MASNTKKPQGKKTTKKTTKKKTKKEQSLTPFEAEMGLIDPDAVELEGATEPVPQPGQIEVDFVRLCRRCSKPLKEGEMRWCSEQCKKIDSKSRKKWDPKKQTKYRPQMAASLLNDYLEWVDDMNHDVMLKTSGGYASMKKVTTPSKLGYAIFLGVHRTTFEDWEVVFPAFRDAMSFLKQYTERWVIDKTQQGFLNPAMSNLILGHDHDIVPKHKSENKHLHGIGFIENIHSTADKLEGNKK